MIKTYRDARTKALHQGLVHKGMPSDVAKRALRKLVLIDTATRVEDLRVPPGNGLEKLAGDRVGQYAIRVNDQWRICFVWADGHAFDVEFCDYH